MLPKRRDALTMKKEVVNQFFFLKAH